MAIPLNLNLVIHFDVWAHVINRYATVHRELCCKVRLRADGVNKEGHVIFFFLKRKAKALSWSIN